MKIKHQKLKSAGAFLTILLLLPYVVTVFVNGIDVLGMSQETCVQTETEDPDGEKTVRTVPWTEYMMGILRKAFHCYSYSSPLAIFLPEALLFILVFPKFLRSL